MKKRTIISKPLKKSPVKKPPVKPIKDNRMMAKKKAVMGYASGS